MRPPTFLSEYSGGTVFQGDSSNAFREVVDGGALALPFPDNAFDVATLIHVGMNIEDKAKLCSEVHRVLRPGSLFGIYDVMKTGDGELTYPVPWATTAESSFSRAVGDDG